MKNFLKKFFDITFWKFIFVGVINTLFGTAVMFVFYNFLHLNYWISSASNYIFGSILSYFLNKYFTFQSKKQDKRTIMKFVINISLCYFAAYGVAKPVVSYILKDCTREIQGNIAMLVGMCLFVALNYCGQRFYVFRENK